MKLLPEIFVILLRISFGQVNLLLGNGSQRAPPKFISENLLSLGINVSPDGLQLLAMREEIEVNANNIRDLLGLTKRVSEHNSKTILRDVSDGSTSLLVTLDSSGRINPTSVHSITILGN